MKRKEIKETKSDYYTCGKCKIDSLTKGRMCPCPRGSCVAKISGSVIRTRKIDLTVTPEQAQWNKENYR